MMKQECDVWKALRVKEETWRLWGALAETLNVPIFQLLELVGTRLAASLIEPQTEKTE